MALLFHPYSSSDTPLTDKEREEFITKLNRFFEPAIKLHKKGRPFRWKTIYKFVRRCKSDIPHRWKLECFCSHLINFLCEIPCHDKSVVTRILYFYTDWVRGMEYERLDRMTHYRNRRKRSAYATLSDVLTKKKPKYVYNDKDYCPLQDSLLTAILIGDFKFMKILVSYGINFYLSHDNFGIREAKAIICEYYRLQPFSSCLRPNMVIQDYRLIMLNRILLPLYGLLLGSGIKRIHVILMVLNAIANEHYANSKGVNYSECLKLFFQIVTTPIFSVREIQQFVNYAFDGIYTKDFTEEICEELRIMFPEVTETYQPRSLKHLSRCQVRNLFVKKPRVLKDEIADLKIPNYIKRYILIENE